MATSKAVKHFDDLSKLAKHEYGISLLELLQDDDRIRREKRIWRLTGVILKRRYSVAVARRPTAVVRADIDGTLSKPCWKSGWRKNPGKSA